MSDVRPQPKMQIRIIPVTPLQQNCSLIWDTATKHAAFVDPGGDVDTLLGALTHFGLTLKRIWLTHGHLDHAGAAAELRERTGVAVDGPHQDDQFWLDQIERVRRRYGLVGPAQRDAGPLSRGRRRVELEGVKFDVSHTPGHTPGHVVIHNPRARSRSSATCCSRARLAARIFRAAITSS